MACPGSFDHLFARGRFPIDVMPRSQAELPNELALRSSVAFAKWMGGVQFAQIRCTGGEIFGIQVNQIVLRAQVVERLLQEGLEKGSESKQVSALADVHGSE